MATSIVPVLAQTRNVRGATTAWPPSSTGVMPHTRPWRSSPLALSTLPPVIPESSEDSHLNEFGGPEHIREHPRAHSPSSSSVASQTGSLSASGYESRNASGSASALALADGEASTSSISLVASTVAHGTSSSQGHASSQTRPARLSKSWGRHTSLAQDNLVLPNVSDMSFTSPPRVRAVSHIQSHSESFSVLPVKSSPSLPQSFSPPRPTSPESTSSATKRPPANSRDPTSNWMSSSPFGPAQTPKFSRLAMASPTVVMPLSAKEYRKKRAKEFGKGKGKEQEPPASSNRVTFVDNVLLLPQNPGVPVVRVLPPPSEDVDPTTSSSNDHSSDRRSQSQHHVDHPPSKPLSKTTMSPRPSSPKQRRPRSRPNTPPRSSPLAAHPPISPKSSASTFFSFASSSDDDNFSPRSVGAPPTDDPNLTNTIPPARPRRRKSYPERLSNGARLSLLEAMNRLSQENAALDRLSGHSQADGRNRLSVASQASGHTLFYDTVESDGEQGQVTGEEGNGHADGGGQRTSIQRTQSLEDLSSALSRTGIDISRTNGDGDQGAASDDGYKGKRNVRVVRISDIVEVSPSPVPRRRRLTKSRQASARGSASVVGAGPAQGNANEAKPQMPTQSHERRTSLLPWKSKGPVVGAGSGVLVSERATSTPIKGHVYPDGPATSTASGFAHSDNNSPKLNSNHSTKRMTSDTTASMPRATPGSLLGTVSSVTPRKPRRYTFSFLPSTPFHRPKREKSNTAPSSIDLHANQNTKDKMSGNRSVESGTDSTSTSIRTITQGSQSTLVPPSPTLHDLTILAPSSGLSGSGRGMRSSVPMLRRLNVQEMETAGVASHGEWDEKGDSTPSLITNGSGSTSSGSLRTPTFPRGIGGGEPFVPRPSALKESFTDTSEDESDVATGGGRTSRMCMHRRHEHSPLTHVGESCGNSHEDGRYLRPSVSARPGSRPGTSDSTLTTATETSGSYVSLSTVPASTPSSSRSASPSPVADDKRDGVVPMPQRDDGDEYIHACTLCGHRSTSPARSLSSSPTRMPGMEEIHPMFTVPLVTSPGGARHTGERKSERHTSISVPPAAAVTVSASPSGRDQKRPWDHMHVNVNGGLVMTPTSMLMNDKVTRLSPSPPPKVKKRRRPQTAPAGSGDTTLKVVHTREGSIDAHFHLEGAGDCSTKHKTRRGEFKFKAVIKSLLSWSD